MYGTGAAARGKTLTDLGLLGDKLQKAEEHYNAVDANPKCTALQRTTAKNKWVAAYKAFDVVYQKYRALPEEKDSWEVEDSVNTAYTANRAPKKP